MPDALVNPPRPSEQGSDAALEILLTLKRLRVPQPADALEAITGRNKHAVAAALRGLMERGRIHRREQLGHHLYFIAPREPRKC